MDRQVKELFDAVNRNDIEKVKFYIENEGLSVGIRNQENQTIAQVAAMNNKLDILTYVANKDPSILKDQECIVLHRAVKYDSLDVVKYMVEKCHVNIFDVLSSDNECKFEGTAVDLAIAYDSLRTLKYFIECRNVDVNRPVKSNTNESQPLLFQAVKYQHQDVIKYFIDVQKADVTLVNGRGENILYVAVRNDDVEFMKFILDEKNIAFDLNGRDRVGTTLVMEAVHSNRCNALHYLAGQKKADVNVPNNLKETPLEHAVSRNYLEICKALIRYGANINQRGTLGTTPLHHVITEDTCKYLIEQGAEINRGDEENSTPLLYAISAGHYEVCKLLVEHGADVNWRNNRNETPVYAAVHSDRFNVLEYLVGEKHAAMNVAENNRGETPLIHALSRNDEKDNVGLYLIKHGADISIKDKQGQCAIHHATRRCNYRLLNTLIQGGADIQAKDKNGKTPLHYAANCNVRFCEYLIKKLGADPRVEDENKKIPADYWISGGDIRVYDLLKGCRTSMTRGRRSIENVSGSACLPISVLSDRSPPILENLCSGEAPSPRVGVRDLSQFQNLIAIAQLLIGQLRPVSYTSPYQRRVPPSLTTILRDRIDPVVGDAIFAPPDFQNI